MTEAKHIVQRIWNYAHVLRDDGVSYSDYVEQITYLLFLRMVHERRTLVDDDAPIPEEYSWQSLATKEGPRLKEHYHDVLDFLANKPGILGTIFHKSQNKVQDPSKLKRLVSMMDGETWTDLGTDVKGEIYEGLLEKNAADVKSGAGQYFTPRPLIEAVVEVMRPEPGMTICDPACGTGGFLLAAQDYVREHYLLDDEQEKFTRYDALRGYDIVDSVVRLCNMNLYLHGIGGQRNIIELQDSLRSQDKELFDMVLTNPPFGKRSSYTIRGPSGKIGRDTQVYEREDFWVSTSNKQLNFLQHIKGMLKAGGRAAVVVPDNVLFEGGAGETIRRKLLRQFDVHTLVRLPTGVFYAQGVKANVLFFDRKSDGEEPQTEKLWIYDFRTNERFTLRQSVLSRRNLDDFVTCYKSGNRDERKETDRFRAFSYEELVGRDKANLDILWLEQPNADDLQSPEAITMEIMEKLQMALDHLGDISEELEIKRVG